MKVLITAGSTQVPIDQVRCISNIFKGKTGHKLAEYFADEGCIVHLLSSNISNPTGHGNSGLCTFGFKTYDELLDQMGMLISTENYDVIIHSAAVSDYKVEETLIKTFVDSKAQRFSGKIQEVLVPVDSSTKISSDNQELYLKLVPTEKIIDKIRKEWNFLGVLVKFKLQVRISDMELIDIAKNSMLDSNADFIVANCLEWAKERAYILAANKIEDITCTPRKQLANCLYMKVKKFYETGM